jgi:hypothetical protein
MQWLSNLCTKLTPARLNGPLHANAWVSATCASAAAVAVAVAVAGKYDESGLEALDYIIASAAKNGVKLILSFIDNWKYYNGVDQFVDWCIPERKMPVPKESGGDTDTDVSATCATATTVSPCLYPLQATCVNTPSCHAMPCHAMAWHSAEQQQHSTDIGW